MRTLTHTRCTLAVAALAVTFSTITTVPAAAGTYREATSIATGSTPLVEVALPQEAAQLPSIAVQANGDGSFLVSGNGFLPAATVTIRVVDSALATRLFSQTSDGAGNFVYNTGAICVLPDVLHFSATDGCPSDTDLTGQLWSNTADSNC